MDSRYAAERLVALYARVEGLERTVEQACAILEGRAVMVRTEALAVLRAGIMEDFLPALLCNPDTTDEQLDDWLSDEAPAEAVAADG